MSYLSNLSKEVEIMACGAKKKKKTVKKAKKKKKK